MTQTAQWHRDQAFELYRDVKAGDVRSVQERLSNGVRPDDRFGHPLLNFAAQDGMNEMVRALLPYVEVDATDRKGVTALMEAAGKGHATTMQILLDAGARLEAVDRENRTVIHHCVMGGNMTAMDVLKRAEIRLNARDDKGQTALDEAITYGKEGLALKLLEWDITVAPSRQHEEARTSLARAARCGMTAVVKAMLPSGYMECKDHEGFTPLLLAAEQGHEACVTLLVREGANLQQENEQGETVDTIARNAGHLDLALWLRRERLADIAMQDKPAPTRLRM